MLDDTITFNLIGPNPHRKRYISRGLIPSHPEKLPIIKLPATLIWYIKYFFIYILVRFIYPPIVVGLE